MPAILLAADCGYAIADLSGRPLIARWFTEIEDAEEYAAETGFDLIDTVEED